MHIPVTYTIINILDIPNSKSTRVLLSSEERNHSILSGGERQIKRITNNCSDSTLVLLVTIIGSLLMNK